MYLDISKALQSPGVEFPFAITLPIAQQEVNGECITFPKSAMLTGIYASAGESVLVRGDLTTEVHAMCSRCLKPVVEKVATCFDEVFVKTLDPDDPDQYAYTGNSLALTDLTLSAVMLALPMRFLCKTDCAGLCPVCGADLNQNTCPCQKEMPMQHPFSALQQLLTKDEEV